MWPAEMLIKAIEKTSSGDKGQVRNDIDAIVDRRARTPDTAALRRTHRGSRR